MQRTATVSSQQLSPQKPYMALLITDCTLHNKANKPVCCCGQHARYSSCSSRVGVSTKQAQIQPMRTQAMLRDRFVKLLLAKGLLNVRGVIEVVTERQLAYTLQRLRSRPTDSLGSYTCRPNSPRSGTVLGYSNRQAEAERQRNFTLT